MLDIIVLFKVGQVKGAAEWMRRREKAAKGECGADIESDVVGFAEGFLQHSDGETAPGVGDYAMVCEGVEAGAGRADIFAGWW